MNIVKSPFNENTKIVNMEMSSAEQKFSLAALAVFQRYGVRKATMEEIASEAGVSKPTLYATFKNKDAALAGAIIFAKGQALKEVEAVWATSKTVAEKLDVLFENLVLAGFDMLHNSPDAGAFDNAVGQASEKAIKQTRDAEVGALQAVFESASGLNSHGIRADDYAEFVMASAMNAKRYCDSRGELEKYMECLKQTVLATVG